MSLLPANTEALLADLKVKYTQEGSPIAFSGIDTIFKFYKGKLPIKLIRQFCSTYESHTIHRDFKKPKTHNPVYCYSPRNQIQMDIATFFDQKENNEGLRYILVLIDVFTKKMWAVAIERKDARAVLQAFKFLYENKIHRIEKLVVDLGGEFWNRQFIQYAEKNHIRLIAPYSSGHATVAERVIRTLKRLIAKWCTENQTRKFVPALPSLIKTYNERYHSSIKMSPAQCESSYINQTRVRGTNEIRYRKVEDAYKPPRLQTGQLVRIARLYGPFRDSYKKRFSEEIYTVHGVNSSMPVTMFTLSDLKGKTLLRGQFTTRELTPVKLTREFHVSKILNDTSNPDKVLVTFHGMPQGFRAWIRRDQIVN